MTLTASQIDTENLYRWQLGGGVAEYDEASGLLTVRGEVVHIENRPAKLLGYLLRHAGAIVASTEILALIWDNRVSENSLNNAISKIRSALINVPEITLKNVARRGYRLTGEVHSIIARVDFIQSTNFAVGQAVPLRPAFRLYEQLTATPDGEVWLTRHQESDELRVVKFARSERRLARLKLEAAQANRLIDRLGERSDLIACVESHFSDPPYFVENAYGGRNLYAWSQAHLANTNRNARTEMFNQAIAAVAAAHGVGILHHSIKPENVLIHEVVAGGLQVSVCDFGVERVWNKDALTSDPQPADLANAMYVAPELLSGARASVQSDVYALGVLLYQFIVGDFRRAMVPGWERDVDDPLLAADIAHATDGDPTRRMRTADTLLEQLRTLTARHAELATQRQRAAELAISQAALARNRARRPWIILTMLALTGVAVVSFGLYRAAETARIAADQARSAAERYASSTSAVQQFLTDDILSQTDPANARFDPQADRKTILTNAAKAIEQRFGADPLTRAALHRALGSAYKALGLRAETRAHLGKSAALFAEQLGPAHELTLEVRYSLAHSEAIDSEFKEAERQLDETDQLAGVRLQTPSSLAILAAAARAEIATLQFQPERALPSYQRALALVDGGVSIEPIRLDVLQQGLADAFLRLDRNAEALTVLLQMEARYSDLLPTTKPALLRLFTRLYRTEKNYPTALTYGEKGVRAHNEVFGPDHFNSIVMLSTLSYLYELVGDCPKGLTSAAEVYQRMARNFGADRQGTLIELGNRGSRRVNCGEYQSGVDDLKTARDQLRTLYGADNAAATSFSQSYVKGLGKLGRFDAAFVELAELRSKMPTATRAAGGPQLGPTGLDLIEAELRYGKGESAAAKAILAQVIDGLQTSNSDPDLLEEAQAIENAWDFKK